MQNNLKLSESRAGLAQLESEYIARSLLRPAPAVTAEQTNDDVFKMLSEQVDLHSLTVIEDDKPVA
jgi:hypothetical protein